MGQLCDDGCKVILTKKKIIIQKQDQVVLEGQCNYADDLWDIELAPTKQHKAHAIIRKDKTKYDLAHYFLEVCFSPPISTFDKSVKNGNYITWPGLPPETKLLRHFTSTINTAKGHLDQERKNLQSTKIPYEETETDSDKYPPSTLSSKTYECIACIESFKAKEKSYMDLTGRFPEKSARGNQYLLVVYDYDSNAILVEPIVNRQKATITRAWKTIHDTLSTKGAKPKLYVLDNEASKELKVAIKNDNVAYELVPPHIHRRNAAERV